MEFKGTKGPWSLRNEFDEKYDQPIINVDSENGSEESFATVWSGLCLDNELDEKTKANAQLISKAPEMLAALITISDFIKRNEDENYKIRLLSREVPMLEDLIKSATEIK